MTVTSSTTVRERLDTGGTIDLRADGKAGAGLVTILQALARSLGVELGFHVQEWPLFSSARKGANVRGFMRISRRPISLACQVTEPQVAMLVSEETGRELDFAAGTSRAVYLINTPREPQAAAEEFRLAGQVVTVPGDRLGSEHLGRPLPNMALLAALAQILGIEDRGSLHEAIRKIGHKRRLPETMIEKNVRCFEAAAGAIRTLFVPGEKAHPLPGFDGYEGYPIAAQSQLRTSTRQETSLRARTDQVLHFEDPTGKCNGCGLCIIHCPEGIIHSLPDERRGLKVVGLTSGDFCKLCRECIETCPKELFSAVDVTSEES